MSVSTVDESGRMVYFSRANGAVFYTFDTSKAKAMAAASFKRSTMVIETENYVPVGKLQIKNSLYKLVKKEIIPKTEVTNKCFWTSLCKLAL